MIQNRRRFVKTTVAGLGAFYFSKYAWPMTAPSVLSNNREDPHFFLQIIIPGGFDSSYLYDARPLSMKAANLMQNYNKEDPSVLTGSNGASCLVTKAFDPIKPYWDRFSILNGMMMIGSGFDGHDQLMNFLLAGDPFGGASFVPHLNNPDGTVAYQHRPLDAVQSGSVFAVLNNLSTVVPLMPASAKSIVDKLQSGTKLDLRNKLVAYAQSRMKANGMGEGGFSKGSLSMAKGIDAGVELSSLMVNVKVDQKEGDTPQANFVRMLSSFFQQGITRSGVLIYNPMSNVDVHDPGSCQKMPDTATEISKTLASIFETLKTTPFDDKRSLFDVTTVMFNTEFGRTMRHAGLAIDQTGTDHNPLTNSMMIGGKGIKGGLVIGASDFTDPDLDKNPLSKAHLQNDAAKIKIMAAPFDYKTGMPAKASPETYKPDDYLHVSAVINTVYKLFSVPTSRYRPFEKNGSVAPTLDQLLS